MNEKRLAQDLVKHFDDEALRQLCREVGGQL